MTLSFPTTRRCGNRVGYLQAWDAIAQRRDQVINASRRLIYEVTLAEDQGNFRFSGTDLPESAKARLDELVAQLKTGTRDVFIEIEGHTDNAG